MSKLSSKKFSSLTEKRKHKHAALLLKNILCGDNEEISLYRAYEELLSLDKVTLEKKLILDRLHYHETKADIPYSMQHQVRKNDTISTTKMLEVDIYLENLRSMHNIGAILRSVEAFRLGTVYLSKKLPASAIEKIQKTAMGTKSLLTIKYTDDLSTLKRPFIAVETMKEAKDCNHFSFPKSFTLLFGNEQYGLSDKALSTADQYIHIPLYGNKNSINVACAFAILANCIRKT